MSRRISQSGCVRLSLVLSLLSVLSLGAEPPRPVFVPTPASRPQVQVHIDAVIYDVDLAKLAELADRTKSPVAEFLKLNGFALTGDKSLSIPVSAVSDKPLSFDIHGQDVTAAFKRIAAPALRTLAGQEGTVLSGGQVPLPVGFDKGRAVEFGKLDIGTKLTVVPNLLDDGIIALRVCLNDSRLGDNTGTEVAGVKIPSVRSWVIQTLVELRSGQHLRFANSTGESGLTQFVQLTPQVVQAEEPQDPFAEAPLPADPFAAAPVPVAQTVLQAEPEFIPTPAAARLRPVPVPPGAMLNKVVPHVEFQVRVYEIDLGRSGKKESKPGSKEAWNELLKPVKEGRREVQLDKCHVTTWTAKGAVSPEQFGESLPQEMKLVSQPKITVRQGTPAEFDYGGSIPQVKLEYHLNHSTSYSGMHRPLATRLSLAAEVVENNRVVVVFSFDPRRRDLKKQPTEPGYPVEPDSEGWVRATAELAIGQTLCVSDFSADGGQEANESLLVTITPELIREVTVADQPPVVADSKPKVEHVKEFVIEDRWPLSDIRVGQEVGVIPVWIGKTSISTSLSAVGLAVQKEFPLTVSKLESLPGGKGRRVTVSLPTDFKKQTGDIALVMTSMFHSSTTNFVVPVAEIDLRSYGWLDDIHAAIDPEHRPRPVELAVGESFMATGIQGFFPKDNSPQQTHGPFALDLLDNDSGGFWRVTAVKTGLTRLLQMQMAGQEEENVQLRRTEYRVKVDTRELESHIKEIFPTAKVSITAVGADALLLRGSAASQDEVDGIVELAGQFKPKVLNRMQAEANNQATLKASNGTIRLTAETVPSEIDSELGALTGSAIGSAIGSKTGSSLGSLIGSAVGSDQHPQATELEQLRQELKELREAIRELKEQLKPTSDTTPKSEPIRRRS